MLASTLAFAALAATVANAAGGGGTFQIRHIPSQKCLDLKDGVREDGTLIQLWDCDLTNSNQLWTLPSYDNHHIGLNGTTKCLDVGENPWDGSQLKIWECYDNIPQQAWQYDSVNRVFHLDENNLVLDAPGTDDGTVMQVWTDFAGNQNQQFQAVGIYYGRD